MGSSSGIGSSSVCLKKTQWGRNVAVNFFIELIWELKQWTADITFISFYMTLFVLRLASRWDVQTAYSFVLCQRRWAMKSHSHVARAVCANHRYAWFGLMSPYPSNMC